jgi:CMP-N,N'-diacetyllegionaminic acid synthase
LISKTNSPSIIALIPARLTSKRVPNKNIRELQGHPLLAYTITAALQSKIFDAVVLSTDSEHYANIGQYYGVQVPFMRPKEFATDISPDIEWVEYTLSKLREQGLVYDCFSILRPTNPFRQEQTIQRAWREFLAEENIDSLRAVEKCEQHPGKMWVVHNKRMIPFLPLTLLEQQPWHSSQFQSLPSIYFQNASLEIAWSQVVFDNHTIAGDVLLPFFTKGYEGFDINYPHDLILAEQLVKSGEATLPRISLPPYVSKKSH